MEASRDLDALVATKVFGWEWDTAGPGTPGMLIPPRGHPARDNHWCAEWDEEGRPDWLPNYSSEIGKAWEIVEKIGLVNLTNGPDGWFCRFGVSGTNEMGGTSITQVDGHGPTASIAICVAGLKAVE